mmetsp:Transcript_46187/g.144844  ORF Transcript_46187/g.144844 Transcript_46187/m.144844 type:complete len:129 (-) Transcript_46187:270-656(-)
MPEKRRRQSKKGGNKRRRGTVNGNGNQRGDTSEGVVVVPQQTTPVETEPTAPAVGTLRVGARSNEVRRTLEEVETAEQIINDHLDYLMDLAWGVIDASTRAEDRWVDEMLASMDSKGFLHWYTQEGND